MVSIPSGEETESNLVDNILGSLSLPNEDHNPISFQNIDEDGQIQRQLLENSTNIDFKILNFKIWNKANF